MTAPPILPVCRPRLPNADRLLPYIARIDAARWYSNFGPLVQELEHRLALRWGVAVGSVATFTNATLALTLALQALARPGASLCLMPSWTFAATAHAVRAAGLEPWFLDVDSSGALSPQAIRDILPQLPAKVAAVVAVAPFGRPLDPAPWAALRDEIGVPVVIDAAAGFDGLRVGPVPAIVSLHATKSLAAGEGGLLVSDDCDLTAECRQRATFGFRRGRQALVAGTNAKMPEYSAAVALAALDEWESSRAAWMAVAAGYRRHLPGTVALAPQFGESWVSSTCVVTPESGAVVTPESGAVVTPESGDCAPMAAACAAAGIETRRWWEAGCHVQPAFADCGAAPLPMTARLAQATLGLPFFVDMTEAEIERVCRVLTAATAL